ncbi:MAG: hypothetical protein PHT58_05320 [Eubacteriales bacterium]|nr:hypothetical protein [Eubacteriales bacterium]
MTFINSQLVEFKRQIEKSIFDGGTQGKESMIRSSVLINLIHDSVKYEFIQAGIKPENIYPHFGNTKPELKMAGFLKQKDQDICIVPSGIPQVPTDITWGPLAFESKQDPYGFDYSTNTLVINVRSQMSSLAKNSDTLFERTFAESQNLHMRYPNIVLGEVYLIPVHEYDDNLVKSNAVAFRQRQSNIEKYISFFNSINGRKVGGPDYAYERCALLVVDFNNSQPHLFRNSAELKRAGYISSSFGIEYENINFHNFVRDILGVYNERYNIRNIMN